MPINIQEMACPKESRKLSKTTKATSGVLAHKTSSWLSVDSTANPGLLSTVLFDRNMDDLLVSLGHLTIAPKAAQYI